MVFQAITTAMYHPGAVTVPARNFNTPPATRATASGTVRPRRGPASPTRAEASRPPTAIDVLREDGVAGAVEIASGVGSPPGAGRSGSQPVVSSADRARP